MPYKGYRSLISYGDIRGVRQHLETTCNAIVKRVKCVTSSFFCAVFILLCNVITCSYCKYVDAHVFLWWETDLYNVNYLFIEECMRKFTTLFFVILLFLGTGCSAVHKTTTPTLFETTRVSEEASKTYVVRFADVFCDKTPVTEQLINDAIIRSLAIKINPLSRVDDMDDWYVFTHAGVHWKDNNTLQIEVKKSLRENGQEVQWLVRTYTADVQLHHDMKDKKYEVRITPNRIVCETASPEYYQYMPDDEYVPSKCNLTNVFPAPWGKYDVAVATALKGTLQDFVDENKNGVYYQRLANSSYNKHVSGNPHFIREKFAAYLADEREGAVVNKDGVFFADKQLVQIVDSVDGVTFMWDIALQEEVGLTEVKRSEHVAEWTILVLTKKYVDAL